MLAPSAPALNRDDALEILEQLVEALREVRELRRLESRRNVRDPGTGRRNPARPKAGPDSVLL
jgi:hypothetical protein